jgi:hypothetical protein
MFFALTRPAMNSDRTLHDISNTALMYRPKHSMCEAVAGACQVGVVVGAGVGWKTSRD